MDQSTLEIPDSEVFVSDDAPGDTKKLWSLHGHPYSHRYSNSSLNSLPALVAYAAATYKQEIAFIYPLSEAVDSSYASLSWEGFDKITDSVASLYSEQLQGELANANASKTQPTVALRGRGTGIEVYITVVALQKLNIRILHLSSALSPTIVQTLYDRCSAIAVIIDAEYSGDPLPNTRKIPLIEDPFDLPTSTTSTSTVRFEDNLDPWDRPSIIVHSSGSTGVPKPIIHTNRSILLMARAYRLFPTFHIQNWYLLFPMQAIASNIILPSAFPYGLVTIFPPRKSPPSPEAILAGLEASAQLGSPVECVHSNPHVLESIFNRIKNTTKDFSPLRNLKIFQSGGAPLADNVSKTLIEEGVNVKIIYGSSELNVIMRTYPHDRSNSRIETMRFLPIPSINTHISMEPVDAGFYEIVVREGFACAAEIWGFGLGTQAQSGELFRTNDLFVRDEAMEKGSWILKGRRDDMLILASGAMNISAAEVEGAIKDEGDGLIKAVMLVGHGREKTGLLVELDEEKDRQRSEDDVWNIVDRVNENLSEKARIGRDMVMVLKDGKGLLVGVKGNLKRKEANEMYGSDIEKLYT
ncbi:MAG: hypothetical protein Q9186_001959 [Xanthomendoza sp. 1 TL-2023]